MENYNSVEYLLENNFSRLPQEIQTRIKELGRDIPLINLNQRSPGSSNRSFNTDTFQNKSWLTASQKSNGLFCFPCLLFCKSDDAQHPWTR